MKRLAQFKDKTADRHDGSLEFMGEGIDKIRAEHLDATQILCHHVKAFDQLGHLSDLIFRA